MNTKVLIAGYGNIGKYAVLAAEEAQDMDLVGVARRRGDGERFLDENGSLPKVDVALICKPTRLVEEYSEKYLNASVSVVDSFDIHSEICGLRKRLNETAKKNNAVAIIAAGWDPGLDSVLRALFLAAAPNGITYTDFGPGMSMGHSVVARSKEGVKDAISITLPAGAGAHKRIVYVELKDGANLKDVSAEILADSYFQDDTRIIQVESVSELADAGHGVHMSRKGRSASVDNQRFDFDMRINNPALTAQIMLACARAARRMPPGAYTMIEIPPIYFLPGDEEALIAALV